MELDAKIVFSKMYWKHAVGPLTVPRTSLPDPNKPSASLTRRSKGPYQPKLQNASEL